MLPSTNTVPMKNIYEFLDSVMECPEDVPETYQEHSLFEEPLFLSVALCLFLSLVL